MTAPVRRCPDHGFTTDERCRVCGADADELIDGERRERLSKFLSGLLRHFPGEYDLALDERGWADWEAVVDVAAGRYGWADERAVAGVVAVDPKGRFERAGGRVRAAYGHSVAVDLERGDDAAIPGTLYHGTDPANLDAIRREGLRPMDRREVHLAATPEDAREIGRRHAADPVVLEVDADGMRADGRRVAKRGRATYVADRVPPAYLSVRDGDANSEAET